MTDAQVYAGAALVGAIAGMRTMSAPAVVNRIIRSELLKDGQRNFLSGRAAASTVTALAAAEAIADKLPFMPKRTQVPSLVARAVSGTLSGAAISSAKKRSVLAGALLGGFGAVAATFGIYHLRRNIHKQLHLPDPLIALVEDSLVAGCGALVLSRLTSAD